MNSFVQNGQKVGGCTFVSLCGSLRKPLRFTSTSLVHRSAFKKQALLLYKMAKKGGGVLYKDLFLTQRARRLAQRTAEERLEGGLI